MKEAGFLKKGARQTILGRYVTFQNQTSIWISRLWDFEIPRLKAQTLRLAVRRADNFALDSLVTFWSSRK